MTVDRDQGNKCFRVVQIPSSNQGFRWEQALLLCRSGPGFRPDLANIESIEENGEVIYLLLSRDRGELIYSVFFHKLKILSLKIGDSPYKHVISTVLF